MRIKCYFALLLASLAAAQSQQPLPGGEGGEGGETMNEQMVQSKQRSMIRQDFEQQFNPWVVQEITAARQDERLQFVESFLLQLQPQEQHEFRWPFKTRQAELQLKIRVFTHENGNDIVIIKNPDEDSRNTHAGIIHSVGLRILGQNRKGARQRGGELHPAAQHPQHQSDSRGFPLGRAGEAESRGDGQERPLQSAHRQDGGDAGRNAHH